MRPGWTHADVVDERGPDLAPGHPLEGRVLRCVWREYRRGEKRVLVWRAEWDAGGVT